VRVHSSLEDIMKQERFLASTAFGLVGTAVAPDAIASAARKSHRAAGMRRIWNRKTRIVSGLENNRQVLVLVNKY